MQGQCCDQMFDRLWVKARTITVTAEVKLNYIVYYSMEFLTTKKSGCVSFRIVREHRGKCSTSFPSYTWFCARKARPQ